MEEFWKAQIDHRLSPKGRHQLRRLFDHAYGTFQQARGFATEGRAAQVFLIYSPTACHVVRAVTADGIDPDSLEAKNAVASVIRMEIAKVKAIAVIQIDEAWVLRPKEGKVLSQKDIDFTSEYGVRNHPDAVDSLISAMQYVILGEKCQVLITCDINDYGEFGNRELSDTEYAVSKSREVNSGRFDFTDALVPIE